MAVALFLIVLASPLLIRGDSQRGDWYDTYQGDGWTYDTPADALLTGSGAYQPSGQWQDSYAPVKRIETPKKEEPNFLDKFRNELTGVGKQIVGGLSKLTGGKIPVAEERSAEPFIDFDFDFNIGHPRLGYLGNGFHVRAADSDGSGSYNRNSDLNAEGSSQTYSQAEPPTGYSNFQTPFVASNPRPQRESPASNLYDYQEPAHQNFIPVSQADSAYETPNAGYGTPNTGYEAPASSYYSPDSGYAVDPNYEAPPYAAPGYEDGAENYYEPVTKPPLHIKIKQDLDSLVDGIVAPIKSLIPGKKTTTSAAASSYQLVPAAASSSSSSYQPVETNQLEPAYEQQEVANRYEPEQTSGGIFATPYGKPPLMEKIRQDFFSWLPKAKREIKFAAAPQAAPLEPEPSAPYYPEYNNLPAKQHYVRQVPAASVAPTVPSFLAGDGNVLFKIIPVQSDGSAPLYQIVPTSAAYPESRPVLSHSTATTFNTVASTQTFSHVPTTNTVHQHQQQLQQQQPQQPAAELYTPSQPSPPVVTYTSQVSHPLPPPQQLQQPEPLPLEPVPEDANIFKKVLNNINPRTRTGRKNDIEAAASDASDSTAESVFYMSAPDMTKESGRSVEPETLIAVVDEPIPGAETHTYEVEMVHEEGRDLNDEVRELLEKVEEIESEEVERQVKDTTLEGVLLP